MASVALAVTPLMGSIGLTWAGSDFNIFLMPFKSLAIVHQWALDKDNSMSWKTVSLAFWNIEA